MIRVAAIACLLAFLSASGPGLGAALTLSEAQALALKESPQLGVLRAEASEAISRASTAGLQNRPVLGIAGGGQFEGDGADRELLPLAYAYAGINLYNGGQTRTQVDMAKLDAERTLLGVPVREFHIRKEVELIFTDIAWRKEQRSLKEKELALFDSHRRKALERQRAGLIGESDVIEFELRRSDIQRDMESLKVEIEESCRRLSLLTGREGIDGIVGYRLPEAMRTPDLKSFDPAGASASARALALDLSKTRFEKDVQAARWGPQVDLEGRAGRLPSEGELDPHKPRFDILLVAKLDLLNGSQKRAEMDEVMARQKKVEAMILAERKQSQNSIQNALSHMENLKRKFSIVEKSRPASDRYYRHTMSEYERGIKNSPDVAHATGILFEGSYRAMELRYLWTRERIALETLLARDLSAP